MGNPANISPLENFTKEVYIHANAMAEIKGTRGHARAIPSDLLRRFSSDWDCFTVAAGYVFLI